MDTPFLKAKPILKKLHDNGYEAFFVGGAVRDYLLNRDIGDIDIATSAKPDEIQQIFNHTIDVGAEHGTIIVLFDNLPYEVTTYRAESGYEDFRRPNSVTYITSLKEDLKRRDFTINAMAMDSNETLYDYFNGREDLKKRVIRTVGKASERFTEDALRMLRAVRFVSQLNFALCPTTLTAIKDYCYLLSKISIERKTIEFDKLLKGTNYQNALHLIVDLNIHQFLPGLIEKEQELMKLSRYDFSFLRTKEEFWTLLTYLIKPHSIEAFLREWKLPVKLMKEVQRRIQFIDMLKDKDWDDEQLYDAGEEIAMSVERLRVVLMEWTNCNERIRKIQQRFAMLPIKERGELAVTGHDVIKIVKQNPGPWVSVALSKIERAVVTNKVVNERNAIKEWLLTCNQDFDRNC